MLTIREMVLNGAGGVVRQGRASVRKNGRCMYRGPDGTKCAIGQLMPDANYRENLENRTVTNPNVQVAAGIDGRENITFASKMQTAHDITAGVPDFIPQFRDKVVVAIKGFLPKDEADPLIAEFLAIEPE